MCLAVADVGNAHALRAIGRAVVLQPNHRALETQPDGRLRLVEPIVRNAQPAVHLPPVGGVVAAVHLEVERQPERLHHDRIRAMERPERVDEGPVPVEEDRFHVCRS